MNLEEIRQLVQIVAESEIADLEITRWGNKVRISKYPRQVQPAAPVPGGAMHLKDPAHPAMTVSVPAASAAVNQSVPTPPAREVSPPPVESKNWSEIKSPMVGTFYRAPAPDAEPYVSEGSAVAKGQVLCIIEAMKLMNEIEADFSCRILEVLVQNAQPVEYNQPLFRVEKT
ncbi:MAG: acetyl-CoA carboxylase biotin carboxyl carrier protein [bacterium]